MQPRLATPSNQYFAYFKKHGAAIEQQLIDAIAKAAEADAADPLAFVGAHLSSEAAAKGADVVQAAARQAKEEGARLPPAEDDKNRMHGTCQQWLADLGLQKMLATLLLEPLTAGLAHDVGHDSRLELPFLVALGKGAADAAGLREALAHLLRGASGKLVDKLAESIARLAKEGRGMAGPLEPRRETSAMREAREQDTKFASAPTLGYGDISTFYTGLEGLVGPPSAKGLQALKKEHCNEADSTVEFTVPNYGTVTKSTARAEPAISWAARRCAAALPSPRRAGD
jgi:hypothetical protein